MKKTSVDFTKFINCAWQSPSDYSTLLEFLQASSDCEYKTFNERLIPGTENQTYGVRLSLLRPLGKAIARSPHWRAFLSLPKGIVQEEVLLEGIVISEAKMSYADRLSYINYFVPKITNWALCDTFVSSKMLAKSTADFWTELPRFYESPNPWAQRFAYCVMMTYYLSADYIDQVFQIILTHPSDHYYVQMIQAWLFSAAFIKQRDRTWYFLSQNKTKLNPTILQMTIRKIRDSYRISQADKDLVLKLKNK